MATAAYRTWIAAGRPWKVAQPIADMVAYARSRGITVLGTIGNETHLTASRPEDHTPFSATAMPVKLPLASGADRYWVCACDLADSKGLGAAILRDARAGLLPWLKYMNAAGWHYSHRDGFATRSHSSDQHIHLSCFSDRLHTSIGGYDPLSEEDPMPSADDIARAVWARPISSPSLGITKRPAYDWLKQGEASRRLGDQVLAQQAAILAAVAGDDVVGAVRAELEAAAIRERAERVAERGQLLDAILAAVPDGPVTTEQLTGALRTVLGSVDGATPQR